jgi:quercetin dioxygenase-like cupin family protein
MRRPTATLKELEMHITTLNEGNKSHDPHTHPDEEIIVVLSGEVEEMINDANYHAGPGSVIFLSSMDPHGIRNIGKGRCEYYAIRWLSAPE